MSGGPHNYSHSLILDPCSYRVELGEYEGKKQQLSNHSQDRTTTWPLWTRVSSPTKFLLPLDLPHLNKQQPRCHCTGSILGTALDFVPSHTLLDVSPSLAASTIRICLQFNHFSSPPLLDLDPCHHCVYLDCCKSCLLVSLLAPLAQASQTFPVKGQVVNISGLVAHKQPQILYKQMDTEIWIFTCHKGLLFFDVFQVFKNIKSVLTSQAV